PPDGKGLKGTFVGSATCLECHPHADQVWKGTPHATATDRLEKEKHPAGRQYDPECMMCHTTGLKHPGGYYDLVLNLANWPAAPAQAPAKKQIDEHNLGLRG